MQFVWRGGSRDDSRPEAGENSLVAGRAAACGGAVAGWPHAAIEGRPAAAPGGLITFAGVAAGAAASTRLASAQQLAQWRREITAAHAGKLSLLLSRCRRARESRTGVWCASQWSCSWPLLFAAEAEAWMSKLSF